METGMLQKPEPMQVDDQAPWENDKLDRANEAENLTQLIRSLTQPFVLSITSPWGTGKTTFLQMWSKRLKLENQPCIFFNAWKNDFSDNPFISFIGEIEQYISENFKPDTPINTKFTNLKKKAGSFFKKAAPVALQMLTRGAIEGVDDVSDIVNFDPSDEGAMANFMSKLLETEIQDYSAKKQSIEGFRDGLKDLANDLLKGEKVVGPLVIFVDELDRCRPPFALELLENIKHLFDVPNIVFVLAVDKGQLKNSVRTLYGNDMKAEGYLRRFIDLEYSLNKPNPIRYVNYLIENYDLSNNPIIKGHHSKTFIYVFAYLAECFNLSLRDQEQAFIKLNIIVRTAPINDVALFLIGFLTTLKLYNEELYSSFKAKNCNPNDIISLFDQGILSEKYSQGEIGYEVYAVEAIVNAYLLDKNQFSTYINEYQLIIDSPDNSLNKRKAECILHCFRSGDSQRHYKDYAMPKQFELIELSGQFSKPG